MQNRLLTAIGVDPHTAYEKHNIKSVRNFITDSCHTQVRRILERSNHPLRNSLLTDNKTSSLNPFYIPAAKTTSFENNAVMLTLKHLRDNVYKTKRAASSTQSSREPPPASGPPRLTSNVIREGGQDCPHLNCKNRTNNGRGFTRLDVHWRTCKP